jgi:tetratricopeptide (TPR) repeat protein
VAVHQGRALAQSGLGDYAAAVGEYYQALALRPQDPALHAARGRAYLVLDQMERARHDFTEAVRLDGTNGPAHYGLGYALVKLGRSAEGVAEARKALELGPPTPGLFYNAARVFAQAAALEKSQPSRSAWRTGDEYRETAVDYLRRALALLESDEKRAEFWHEVVRRDGALSPLQRSYRFADLAEYYNRLPRRTARQEQPRVGPQ